MPPPQQFSLLENRAFETNLMLGNYRINISEKNIRALIIIDR